MIKNSVVYTETAKEQLSGLYYLGFEKSYSENKSIAEPIPTVMHFQKMMSIFSKYYLKKFTTTSLILDSALLLLRPTINPTTKQKRDRSVKSAE